MKDYKDLKRFAERSDFVVPSRTGGSHNRGSKHFSGLAIDVRTRGKSEAEIDLFMRKCAALGVKIRDEKMRPTNQKVWTGAHLHLEITALTSRTICEFQRRQKLTVDGIAGANPLAALDRTIL